MAKDTSNTSITEEDPFNEDEAERRFLNSKPTCFIVVGKPGSGKSTLAKKLARAWKCELINGSEIINQGIELQTELGANAQDILLRGEAIPEEVCAKVLVGKVSSPEVAHHGYVLDGFPSLCEDWLSMADQLDLVKNLPLTPDFIINIKIPDKDLEKRRCEQRVDPLTDTLYTKSEYAPEVPTTDEKDKDEDEEEEEEEEEAEEEMIEEEEEEEEEREEITPELVARLVTRPEDLPQNVASSIKKYRDMMLRTLEDYMADHDQQKLIELDGNENPKVVFKSLMMKLNTFKLNHALVPLRLQGGEEGDEISDDTETDDLLRTLAATEMVAPKFRWRRSKWGRACPVSLKEGNIVQGMAQFSVSFLDKLFVMSTNEALAHFMRNPRPYLAPHLPRPPCKVCVLGPPHSGKTTVAHALAQRYNAKVFDIDELIKPRKEAAKKKMMDEIRDETIESAISKITAAKQTQQLEAPEEEEEPDPPPAKESEEAGEEKEGDEEESSEGGKTLEGDEANDNETPKKSAKQEIPIDANHPEVVKIVNEVMAEAEKREPELSPDEYTDVIEEAVQQRYAELQELNPDGPHAGGFVLDNFPRTREQFTSMIERNIVPDEVICLKDDSENGEFLLKRWYHTNKEELHEKWEARRAEERARQEAERAERERKAREEAERKAAEEAKRKEEEERLRREQAEEAGEGEEGGEKEEGEQAGEGKEGEEKAKEEEGEEEEGAAAETDLKDADTPELQPSGEDLSLGGGPEEEELVLDSDMPPNTPETEEFKNIRTNFDRDFPQLLSVLKGTNNIEPITVSVEKETDNLNKEIVKKIEAPFNYRGWEYTGMDQDEEEEDFAEEEEEEEEEEEDIYNKDKKKIFGDTNHHCPVMLKDKFVLWPGIPECAAKYRERTYFFSSMEARGTFLEDPENYLPSDKPLEPPPIRLLIVGPKGAGKTLHGRQLAKQMGVFHISFKDRLQELIIAKTKKRIGPEYDDDEEESGEQAITAPEGLEGTDAENVPKDGEGEGEGEEGTGGEAEPELTDEEESIRANLAEGEALPNETLDKILPAWWNEEPFRSTGFILEDFPRTEAEARYLSSSGLFPDIAVILVVEDTEIVDRLLPPLLDKWRKKRDKREAEKERQRALAKKQKEEDRARRREEKMAEITARKAEKMARRAQRDSDDSEEEAEEDEEEDDIEALLDAEEEEEDEMEEEEEESEEDAIERLKTEIGDRYDEETGRVATVQETLEEISIPRVEINGGRKPRIVEYCIKKVLKPVVDFRESLFDRCFAIDGYLANRMLIMGYKFPSRFGRWCPVKLLEGEVLPPQHGSGVYTYPVVYRQHIYFCSGRDERDTFMQCPSRFLKQPSPKPVVPIKMAIIGPPKSGKTGLANRFVAEYGVVRLSIGEAVRKVLNLQPYTELTRQINLHLKAGNPVPDELAVQALEVALLDMQCQTRGFILDGYPVTKRQVELLTERKIIPVRVVELQVEDDEVLRRGTADRHAPTRVFPLHDSQQILGIRLNAWQQEIAAVRDWYQKEHRNWVPVDGQRSKWWIWNQALDEARKSVRQIQTYLQRLSEGKAASVADMCITPNECLVRLGDYGQYCPVSLADRGELVDCSVNSSLEFAAEFRGRYYKMASRVELEKFLADPARYVPPLAPRKLPEPELLPKRKTAADVKIMFPKQIELKGYCPVTYLDGKLRYENIVPGEADLVVEYREKLFCFESEEKLQKFMRLPEKYYSLTLPHKLPPRKEPLLVSGLPMLGYMEQSVATALTKALTAVGCFKPKYPFVDSKKSAMLYIAYHLKAYNPKSSEYVRKKYKQKLMRFEEECELIGYLGKEMTNRYREPEDLPIDFDHKLSTFLALKDIEPTTTWCA
ncbi:hypothetical protein ACROYT_G021608 [Oculina patagonica]